MATISAHLKCLKEVELIDSEKVDQHVYYSTNCLNCGDNCNICQFLDSLELDEQTVSLLKDVERLYPNPQKLYGCH